MVVVDEIRIPLIGLGSEDAVEPLEAAADRPLPLDRGQVHLVLGAQMPLADHVGVPPLLPQHFGDGGALERDVSIGVRKAGCRFGDAGHAIGGVVATGQQTRPGRRAQRGRVELGVGQTALRDPVDVGCFDQPAELLHGREADVVEDDVHDARCAVRRHWLAVRVPVGHRVLDVDVDAAGEGLGHRSPYRPVLATTRPLATAFCRSS